jgi:hypothetical protein
MKVEKREERRKEEELEAKALNLRNEISGQEAWQTYKNCIARSNKGSLLVKT